MNYRELVYEAIAKLKKHRIYEGFAKRLMIERTLEKGLDYFSIADTEICEVDALSYRSDIQRLTRDEPLAHVLGYEWFFGRKFIITPDVLIPREETEELVENVLIDLDEYFADKHLVVADVGTGCGNIGLTLKAEEPDLQVHVTDICEAALAIARQNAEDLEIPVHFHQGDLAQPLLAQGLKLDVLLCNPPYIQAHEEIQPSVFKYEPHLALFGGKDGLKYYRKLLEQSHRLMKPSFMMAFEIGYEQSESLTQLIKNHYPHAEIITRKDLNQHDRMVFVYHHLNKMIHYP